MAGTGAKAERVSIRRLKARVVKDYPPGAAIREVLVSEPDELPREEILSKLDIWVRLIRLAESERGALDGQIPRRPR